MEENIALSLEERKAYLSAEIAKYLRQGFHVINQTDTTAQLQKDKGFSCLLFLLLLLLGIIPGIIYILVRRDRHAYITVDEFGNVNVKIDY